MNKQYKKHFLINGLLFVDEKIKEQVEKLLEDSFGKIVCRSNVFDFSRYSSYYEKEMGKGIKRQWVVHNGIKDKEFLYEYKLKTVEIEKKFLKENKRMVNIDPGILSLGNLILFSTKYAFHRIYLGKGIWAELTLVFENKSYRECVWTYPDYKDNIPFFNGIREKLKKDLRCL